MTRGALALAAAGFMAGALLFLPATMEAQYVGVKRCRPCHLPQAKSWKTTKMAQAFELLKPGVASETKQEHGLDPDKDYTHDPECLACHVTGYGQPGGFESIETTPELAGVQCEVCHGAGEPYLKPNLMSLQNREYKRADLVEAGMTIPDEQTCRQCHNEKSPFYQPFDYASRKAEGTHKHLPLRYAHD